MTRVSFKDSAFCAVKGLFRLFSEERNIKLQMLISSIVIFSAFLLKIQKGYILALVIIFFLGMVLELFNTNIERLIDIISPEYNKELGKIKDSMAGIVLLTFIVAMMISLAVLYIPIVNFWIIMSKNYLALSIITVNIILLSMMLLVVYIKNKN